MSDNLFCHDLPTEPDAGIGTILVTGASGYVGGRLVPELVARGYRVRIMVRYPSSKLEAQWPGVEIAVADALKPATLDGAMKGVDTAYYLIHSMLLGPEEFERADILAAKNFRECAERNGLKRIIYLGGLGDIRGRLSDHLRSRIEVAEELERGEVPVTILRAAIIVGSGSAAYEIIKNIVRKLFIIPVPTLARNSCQPVSIRDVVKYLVGVLEISETSGETFDIGGTEVLTYWDTVRITAGVLGKRRFFFRIPFNNIPLISYVASLLTPVPASITRCLMEGLKSDVVCQEDAIKRHLPFEPISFKESIVRAVVREEQDKVSTRWSDAYPPSHELATRLGELEHPPAFEVSYSISTSKDSAKLFRSICRIGGREGWFHGNWMWRLRGMIDRLMLGVGVSRGRREYTHLEIDDVVDFWRVEDLKKNKRLLLRSEMRLPGSAWLEFVIDEEENGNRLAITAFYETSGLFGKVYWYIFLPFHDFIFKGLIKQIERRS